MSKASDTKDIMTLGLLAFGGYILLTKVLNPLGSFFGKKTDRTDCTALDPWCESSKKCMSITDHMAGLCDSDRLQQVPPQPVPPQQIPPPNPDDSRCTIGTKWCEPLSTCIPQDHKCTGLIISNPFPPPPPPPSRNPNQVGPYPCARNEKWCAPIGSCVSKDDPCIGFQGESFDGMNDPTTTDFEKKKMEA